MSNNPYKKLGGQTIIYGFGTIVPRMLNYVILTIYYTRKLEVQEYGIITEIYAYIAIFLVILTYGMETGYFKFSVEKNKNTLFSSAVITLFSSSAFFILIGLLLSGRISEWMQYKNYPELIRFAILIVSIDAFSNIFIAKIRIDEKLKKFVFVQLLNVVLTIVLVVFFLEVVPFMHKKNIENGLINYISGFSKIYLIFLANLISSIVRLILLSSELNNIRIKFDRRLIKALLLYSLPLLIAQLSGVFNESLDRILLRHFLPDYTDKLYQIGIYGANYRIAMIMTIFIQMFRYAAEPFYFKNYHQREAKKLYADVFRYFTIFCAIIFLMVMLYIDYFKFFIDKKFHDGLHIVPIILISAFLTGVLFNMNVWYKLTGKTYYGVYIIGSGAVITILLNAFFIPRYGYYGSALTHLISNIVMIFISYMFGKKYYAIPYEWKKVVIYVFMGFILYITASYSHFNSLLINTIKNSLLFFVFLFIVIKKEDLIGVFIKGDYENKNN